MPVYCVLLEKAGFELVCVLSVVVTDTMSAVVKLSQETDESASTSWYDVMPPTLPTASRLRLAG